MTPVKAPGPLGRPPKNLKPQTSTKPGELTMATLTIKDLMASKELDSKAMTAVAGGSSEHASFPAVALFDLTSVSTTFAVDNWAANASAQANGVGPFNFGNVAQANNSHQHIDQAGNGLGAPGIGIL
jgi:hypothetical protein